MNIVLIGATGFIGSALLTEALNRGHRVTALVRKPEALAARDGLTARALDVNDTAALTEQLRGTEAVITAYSGHSQEDVRGAYLQGFKSILAAVKAATVPRLLTVGGAGSLEVAPGLQAVDTPDFPAAYKGSALGARDALHLLRDEPSLDWSYLSPSALIQPGQRTGQFRLGSDQLLTRADGSSEISVEDYAVAMIDELETPSHQRQRFTVGY